MGADAAPAFDTLKGKTIELRWRYYATEGDERKQVCARLPSLEHSHAMCACHVHLRCMCMHGTLYLFMCKQVYIWCSGEMVEIADGKTTKKSSRCKSPLPWGAVRICWPEDKERDEPETFVWSVLKPVDFNRDLHLGWRFDAAQLAKDRAGNDKILFTFSRCCFSKVNMPYTS